MHRRAALSCGVVVLTVSDEPSVVVVERSTSRSKSLPLLWLTDLPYFSDIPVAVQVFVKGFNTRVRARHIMYLGDGSKTESGPFGFGDLIPQIPPPCWPVPSESRSAPSLQSINPCLSHMRASCEHRYH